MPVDLVAARGRGRPDIVARNSTTKTTRIYANVDGTRLSPGVGATTTSLNLVSLSSDADGNNVPDIVSNVGGNLTLLPVYRKSTSRRRRAWAP